jgi:hypothetical protein
MLKPERLEWAWRETSGYLSFMVKSARARARITHRRADADTRTARAHDAGDCDTRVGVIDCDIGAEAEEERVGCVAHQNCVRASEDAGGHRPHKRPGLREVSSSHGNCKRSTSAHRTRRSDGQDGHGALQRAGGAVRLETNARGCWPKSEQARVGGGTACRAVKGL